VAAKKEDGAGNSSAAPSPKQPATTNEPSDNQPTFREVRDRKPADFRTAKSDGTDINRTSESVRNACIGLIYNGLARYLDDSALLSPVLDLSSG
jgi:hypothetical protein